MHSGAPPSQRLVLIALAYHADQEGVCWPSINRISSITGLSEATVIRCLTSLEQAGLVSYLSRSRRGNRFLLSGIANSGTVTMTVQNYHHASTEGEILEPQKILNTHHDSSELSPCKFRTVTMQVLNTHHECITLKEHLNEHIQDVLPEKISAPKKRKNAKITIDEFIQNLNGEKIVPQSLHDYCRSIGLPDEFLFLEWNFLIRQYGSEFACGTPKRYSDWRRTLANAVRGRWGNLWSLRDGEFFLTTAGEQLKREITAQREETAA